MYIKRFLEINLTELELTSQATVRSQPAHAVLRMADYAATPLKSANQAQAKAQVSLADGSQCQMTIEVSPTVPCLTKY